MSGLEAEGESLRWRVTTDLQAWQDAVERRDWRAAGDCYRGLLLDGLEGEGTGEFYNLARGGAGRVSTYMAARPR